MIKRLTCAAVFAILAFATPSFATTITPNSFGGPFCLSPINGIAACSITTQYSAGGLVFSQMGVGTATFTDPPNAWGGINGNNAVDLFAPVNAKIVLPSTSIQGVTNAITVEAGSAGAGALRLSVFDIFGNLLTSRLNGLDGNGPNGRSLIIITGVNGIGFFSVSTPGNDSFGVDSVTIGDITGSAAVPEPASLTLVGLGLAALGRSAWRRRTAR